MQNGNGKNGWITKFLATALWGIIVVAISFMGRAVVANDQLSRTRDTNITTEARFERADLRKEIKLELKEINQSNTQILVAIAELKKDIQNIK